MNMMMMMVNSSDIPKNIEAHPNPGLEVHDDYPSLTCFHWWKLLVSESSASGRCCVWRQTSVAFGCSGCVGTFTSTWGKIHGFFTRNDCTKCVWKLADKINSFQAFLRKQGFALLKSRWSRLTRWHSNARWSRRRCGDQGGKWQSFWWKVNQDMFETMPLQGSVKLQFTRCFETLHRCLVGRLSHSKTSRESWWRVWTCPRNVCLHLFTGNQNFRWLPLSTEMTRKCRGMLYLQALFVQGKIYPSNPPDINPNYPQFLGSRTCRKFQLPCRASGRSASRLCYFVPSRIGV